MENIRLQNYILKSEIGRGGMGVVYYGVHTKINREVAVKKLIDRRSNKPEFRSRFLNEARILARISHPNIVGIYDFIDENDNFYIVLEYVAGKSLDRIIDNNPNGIHHLRTIKIFSDILAAFSYAHEDKTTKPGIIHRDIKPGNIIIAEDDTPKILDFGIAKVFGKDKNITKAGTKMGTLLYMSPEQVLGYEVDKLTDIYSLGILLYEMLTGKSPYETNTESEYELMENIVKQNITPLSSYKPELDDKLNRILLKACAKDTGSRFQNCDDFLEALQGNEEIDLNIKESGITDSSSLLKTQVESTVTYTDKFKSPGGGIPVEQSQHTQTAKEIDKQVSTARKGFLEFGGRRYDINTSDFIIGRGVNCNVFIDDGENKVVSRQHCEISIEGGSFMLTDLDSKNGTFVNGIPIKKTVLNNGDVIRLGFYEIFFRLI